MRNDFMFDVQREPELAMVQIELPPVCVEIFWGKRLRVTGVSRD